jgi:flavin reductase (DIM6/NTAB) family NADH-FMN oxidoreductase RutF
MTKTQLELTGGRLPILGQYPTIIIGVVFDGKPDFTTVAWTGVAASVPPAITIALQHHRHSLRGVRQNMAFSVNIPSANQVKETDYCGLASGARIDKAADCGFTIFYGASKNIPFIEECPINHACEVIQILNLGSHELIVGRINESYISDECLTDGKPDMMKVNPFVFSELGYHTIGAHIGDAFRCGIAINPKARLDTLEEIKKMVENEKA